VIEAEDRFTQYGLIGAAWVTENCIEHFVLSCRALGLGIEEAFLALSWPGNLPPGFFPVRKTGSQ
jgi:predicted enzyme involved in methoxymalonyl-ACP biosynthesis